MNSGFHFEINSLEDFIAFVMWARGELTDAKLLEMSARLKQSTKALLDAEQADANKGAKK